MSKSIQQTLVAEGVGRLEMVGWQYRYFDGRYGVKDEDRWSAWGPELPGRVGGYEKRPIYTPLTHPKTTMTNAETNVHASNAEASRPQPSSFGKDHWSLLAYVETCCVDALSDVGQLDRLKMRCNPNTHPLLVGNAIGAGGWKLDYSSRMAGFFDFVDRSDPEKAISAGFMLRDHDDWDCLDDLEACGFLEVLSLAQGTVRMTPKGIQVAAALRKYKAEGGMYTRFVFQAAACEGV